MKNSGIEWIGEIPDSWEYFRLKDYYEFEKGKNAAIYTQEYIGTHPGEFPVYSGQTENDGVMGNISSFDYDEEECLFTTTVGAKVMTPKVLNGKFSLSQNCLIMKRVKPCCNKYVFYQLFPLFDYTKSMIPTYMQPSLRISDLNTYGFFSPNEIQQKKIADHLDDKCAEVDKLIEVQQAQIDKLKEYKQSVITEAVTKGLDPTVPMKDVSNWMRRIPCNWFDPKIKYFCSIESCGTPERTHPEYWNCDINWFKTGELHNDEIFDSEEKITVKAIEETAAKIFPRNAILVAMYGQGKTRGMTALLKKESATNQACAAIQLKTKIYEVNYLWWVLKGAYKSLRERANGSGQPNLSVSLISEFEISLPPLLEQQKIICYLDDKCAKIDKLIAIKQAKIDKLQEYKKSLIYEYVTGKKEVM